MINDIEPYMPQGDLVRPDVTTVGNDIALYGSEHNLTPAQLEAIFNVGIAKLNPSRFANWIA